MGRLQGEWRWLVPFLGMTAILLAMAQALGLWFGSSPFSIMSGYALRVILLAPFMCIAGLTVLMIGFALRREKEPTRAAVRFIRGRFDAPGSAFAVLIAMMAIPVLMGAFGTLKMLLPLAAPFSWDPALATADHVLFFGVDPWRITHALFGAPATTKLIDALYTLWVPLVMIAVFVAAISPANVRARYFLSFAAAWLLIGTIGAYALSSAGPCYAARLGLDIAPWFQPLMQRLGNDYASVGGVAAYGWQDTLWQSYVAREYGFARGISAAPSMHNAICLLYVLALRNAHPLLRGAAIFYAAVIFVGSVHLGWHYAIDGLIAFAAMLAIWSLAGRYLAWCGYSQAAGAAVVDDPTEAEPVPA